MKKDIDVKITFSNDWGVQLGKTTLQRRALLWAIFKDDPEAVKELIRLEEEGLI